MKLLFQISGIIASLILITATAQAKTTTFKVMLDPFNIVSGEFDLQPETECEFPGTSGTIKTCKTPGSTFTINNRSESQTAVIENASYISSTHGENIYLESYYSGYITFNRRRIPAYLRYKSKNGVPFWGSFSINQNQNYTITFDE